MIINWRPHRYRGGSGAFGLALVLGISVGVTGTASPIPTVTDFYVVEVANRVAHVSASGREVIVPESGREAIS